VSVNWDVGLEVLDFVYTSMKIDERWSTREPRGFTWWGHRLAQRVWAEPVRPSDGFHIVRVHATTALLRKVSDTAEMRTQLATANMFMHLGALTWSPTSRRVGFHSAAYFHAENRPWLQLLFLAAVGLQAADAHIKADGLARVLGGEPDVSAHPASGARREPDDMLNVIASLFAPQGAGASPWTEADFKAAADMTPRPWVLANGGTGGMTAEFACSGDLPAMVAGRAETALFTASSTERHPQLGSGLVLRLQLPFNFTKRKAVDIAWMLNMLEASETTDTHTLGAWSLGLTPPGRTDAYSVTFVSFIPAAAYRKGLLDVLAVAMAVRARWIANMLPGDDAIRHHTPEQFAEVLRHALRPERSAELRDVVRAGTNAIAAEAVERAAQADSLRELWRTGPEPSQIQCWSCQAPLAVTPEMRGKKVKCARCGMKQTVPR
jgi:hypothetical protein